MPRGCWVKYVAEYEGSYAALLPWSCCSRTDGKNKPLLAEVFEITFLEQIMALNPVPVYSYVSSCYSGCSGDAPAAHPSIHVLLEMPGRAGQSCVSQRAARKAGSVLVASWSFSLPCLAKQA